MTCFRCLLLELAEPKPATALPVMLLYAPRQRYPNAPPARAVCGVPVCEEHKSSITLDYLLTDEGFAWLCSGFLAGGKVLPERSATELEFIDIQSEEAVTFMSSSRRSMH